jgi:hypothetical protein
VKILLGDFNTTVDREDIFKPTIGNKSLHESSNDNGVRVVNFATSKNLIVKNMMFPYSKNHKFTWISPDGNAHNQIEGILIEDDIQVYLMPGCSGQQIVILMTVWWWFVCMYVCMCKGWAYSALAPRPTVVCCDSPFFGYPFSNPALRI